MELSISSLLFLGSDSPLHNFFALIFKEKIGTLFKVDSDSLQILSYGSIEQQT